MAAGRGKGRIVGDRVQGGGGLEGQKGGWGVGERGE